MFARVDSHPISEISYAGVKYYGSSDYIDTMKASGKLKVKANKDFVIKKIEVGTTDGENINYKPVKNGSKITLANSTVYTQISYSSGDKNDLENYYHESGEKYDYLKPGTFIKVTYYDKLLKVTREVETVLINIK